MTLPEVLLNEVKKFYEPGMSMTEMEYRFAKQSMIARAPVYKRGNSSLKIQEFLQSRLCVFIRTEDALMYVCSFTWFLNLELNGD